MKRAEFVEGAEWALRVPARIGEKPARVRLLLYSSKPRKVRVEHVEGEKEGLKEWVPPGQLLVPWPHVTGLLAEEERKLRLDAYVDTTLGGVPEGAVEDAVSLVIDAAGEPDIWLREQHGYGQAAPGALSRLCFRAGLNIGDLTRYPAYLGNGHRVATEDREWVLPWDRLVTLARHLTQAEAEHVTRWVDAKENRLVREGYEDSVHRWSHDWLRRQLPAHALVRQWAGGRDERITYLEEEVTRLRGLVERAARQLSDAGLEGRARRLRRDAGSL